jgi:hypothetical protein
MVKITKVETAYDLTYDTDKGKFSAVRPYKEVLVRAVVHEEDGSLTIKPMHGGQYFEFKQSGKVMVEAIGRLLLAASELEGVK